VIEALVLWADVVTESFAPGVIGRIGLDYESLRGIKPDLIVISSCLMGQTGSLRNFAGFGNLAASVTGFQLYAGWPDRAPAGPAGAYTDYISARYNAIAILAALDHRRRTGEGQYIDQSQAEAAFHFLAPELLDHSLTGRTRTRVGNDDREMFPHGVFRALGADRWVAIAVRDARDWRALCDALGRADWRDDAALRARMRRARRAMTRDLGLNRDAGAIETELQARGVRRPCSTCWSLHHAHRARALRGAAAPVHGSHDRSLALASLAHAGADPRTRTHVRLRQPARAR
jgi:benzylsuccinate CoA-transferase BbsF subunit